MVFTSAVFLFVFLPVCLIAYFAASRVPGIRLRNLVLLGISLAFYAWSGVGFCLLLMVSTVLNYWCGLAIDRAKAKGQKQARTALTFCVIYNLLLLGVFKYFNFFAANFETLIGWWSPGFHLNAPVIPLPVGISFYTFQILSYQIDLYRGKAGVQKNILDLGLYIMLFPQLIAGPIVRYVDVEREISCRRTDFSSFAHGTRRFMAGFSKKILLADRAGALAEAILSQETLAMPWAWFGILCYVLQIYLDFSAYSDMAIGLGEIFGFHFLENFIYPYTAKSVQEFWKRWHISLSGWFRDYVYIPLGGSRKGTFCTYRNLLIVFFLTGLWHGAGWTFIMWGLLNGVFICLERAGGIRILEKLPGPVRRIYVMAVFSVTLVFFYFDTMGGALGYLRKMLSFDFTALRDISVLGLFNWETAFFLCAAVIGCTPVCQRIRERLGERAEDLAYWVMPPVFGLAVCYMMSSGFNPFIYFRF